MTRGDAFAPWDAEPDAAFARSTAQELPTEGLGPLVVAAAPLLRRIALMRAAADRPRDRAINWKQLRQDVLEEIRQFEERATQGLRASAEGSTGQVHRDPAIIALTVKFARSALCAGIDEAAQVTPEGRDNWIPSLLVELHGDASGGNSFFDVLEQLVRQPARFIDLLEVYFLCLAFGFKGRFLQRLDDDGPHKLKAWHQRLASIVIGRQGDMPADLTPGWRGVVAKDDPRVSLVRLPWIGVAIASLVLLVFLFNYVRLSRVVSPVIAELRAIDTRTVASPQAPPVSVTLPDILARETLEDVLVEHEGNKTRITLLAPNLFASGNAALNAQHLPTIERIARALNQVPGRIVIEGHTDDQPIRSQAFDNNLSLSRARAAGVAEMVQRGIDDPDRISWTGFGSDRPRHTPPSRPENRARNRRVEIIHDSGSS